MAEILTIPELVPGEHLASTWRAFGVHGSGRGEREHRKRERREWRQNLNFARWRSVTNTRKGRIEPK